jgi:hypothetical protein
VRVEHRAKVGDELRPAGAQAHDRLLEIRPLVVRGHDDPLGFEPRFADRDVGFAPRRALEIVGETARQEERVLDVGLVVAELGDLRSRVATRSFSRWFSLSSSSIDSRTDSRKARTSSES